MSRLQSICVASMVFKDNYYGGELIRRTEVEVRVRRLKNGKAAGKDGVMGETIKGGNMAVDWIWRLCNMGFELVLKVCCDCSTVQE